ncbi:MAG: acyl carrier protein [Planctomycetota bacterium]
MRPTIDEIITLVRLQLGLKRVRAEQYIVEELGAESADVVNIIATVEEKYQIYIAQDELINIRTVADLYELVKSRV